MTDRPFSLSSRVLAEVAERWPNPMQAQDQRLGNDLTPDERALAYAREQFLFKVRFGLGLGHAPPPFWGKRVIEVGCGHGGISAYLASVGATHVVGVDVNQDHLRVARRLAAMIEQEQDRELPVSFMTADAMRLPVPDGSIDIALADNMFEHVDHPDRLLDELRRVLRPDGVVLVPTFSSIASKYGLHLKIGLKLPWANLVFDESTIVDAVYLRAAKHPDLYDAYPGLESRPNTARDLRAHHDLNDITYAGFRDIAERAGFTVAYFRVHATPTGQVLRKLAPRTARTKLLDVLSTGAGAVLQRSSTG